MNDTPIISVIIPCRNAARTIHFQLDALSKQDCAEPWEVIVADNGSTDDTVTIVQEYKNRIPNLSIVDAGAKSGASYARNVGVRCAKGTYVAFCDADDEVDSGWLSAILTALKKHNFVASRMDPYKLNAGRYARLHKYSQTSGLIQYTYVKYLPHAGASGLGVRKDLHDDVGGFDEDFKACEDCDYCWKIQQRGIKLHFEPGALIHIRHREKAIQRFKQAMLWGSYNVLLIKKHLSNGMPSPTFKDMYAQWKYILELIPKVRDTKHRDRLYWAIGYRIGQVIGSVKHRYLAL